MNSKGKKVFVTFYPVCEDVHLTKDVGMIPYILHRDFGYDSYLMCYRNGDYSQLETDVPGLKIIFLQHNVPFLERLSERFGSKSSLFGSLRLFSTIIDAAISLKKHGAEIDALQVYHLNLESILMGLVFRIINRKGILYMKLDLDSYSLGFYRDYPAGIISALSPRRLLFLLASFDIISAETIEVYSALKNTSSYFRNNRDRIFLIPNGVDAQRLSPMLRPFRSKENKIIHVGRMGSRQKASELVLEAFSDISADFPDWKLTLVGPMDSSFSSLLDDLKIKNPLVSERISYQGFIKRDLLYKCYSEAKVMMVPSRYESFGLVAVEAGIFGNVILGSDIPPFRELTDNGRLGYLCPVDSIGCLTKRLRYILSNSAELETKSGLISEHIMKNYNWSDICGKLNRLILLSLGENGTDLRKT
ncbi:Glycosyltransferase Gtf1 [uncultured archaeon]|nr:Glycosyltransferase Gtf1 [uncultured archaeon]